MNSENITIIFATGIALILLGLLLNHTDTNLITALDKVCIDYNYTEFTDYKIINDKIFIECNDIIIMDKNSHIKKFKIIKEYKKDKWGDNDLYSDPIYIIK